MLGRLTPGRRLASAQPAPDGVAGQPQGAGDRPGPQALLVEAGDLIEARLALGITAPLALLELGRWPGLRRRHIGVQLGRDRAGGLAQLGRVPVEHLPERVTAVAQQVPAVGDLDRLRRPLADAVGVGTGAVAADDLDAGMALEPGRQRLGLPVGQQVDDAAALEVA